MSRKEVDERHKAILSKIGGQLSNMRQSNGVTIQNLANEINVSRNGLSKMEAGEIYFNLSTLLNILDHYGEDHISFFKSL